MDNILLRASGADEKISKQPESEEAILVCLFCRLTVVDFNCLDGVLAGSKGSSCRLWIDHDLFGLECMDAGIGLARAWSRCEPRRIAGLIGLEWWVSPTSHLFRTDEEKYRDVDAWPKLLIEPLPPTLPRTFHLIGVGDRGATLSSTGRRNTHPPIKKPVTMPASAARF